MEDIQCTMNHNNKQQSQEMMLQPVYEANSTVSPITMTPAIPLEKPHNALSLSLAPSTAD